MKHIFIQETNLTFHQSALNLLHFLEYSRLTALMTAQITRDFKRDRCGDESSAASGVVAVEVEGSQSADRKERRKIIAHWKWKDKHQVSWLRGTPCT